MEPKVDFQNALDWPIGLITRCALSKPVDAIEGHQVI